MGKTSEWFEARSTEQDAQRIQRPSRQADEAMILAAARRRGADDVLSLVRTMPEPNGSNDEPGNSL